MFNIFQWFSRKVWSPSFLYPYNNSIDLLLLNIAKNESWKLFSRYDKSKKYSFEDHWYNEKTGEIASIWRANGASCLGAHTYHWLSNGKAFYYESGSPSTSTYYAYMDKCKNVSDLEVKFHNIAKKFDLEYGEKIATFRYTPIQRYEPELDDYVKA